MALIVNGYTIEPYADLEGVDFEGVDLTGVDLIGANLRGANLSKANLSWVDLEKADLWDANFDGANLWGTRLQGANLQDVKNIFTFQFERDFAFAHKSTFYNNKSQTIVKIGYETKTLEDWLDTYEKYVEKEKYSAMQIKMYHQFLMMVEGL